MVEMKSLREVWWCTLSLSSSPVLNTHSLRCHGGCAVDCVLQRAALLLRDHDDREAGMGHIREFLRKLDEIHSEMASAMDVRR